MSTLQVSSGKMRISTSLSRLLLDEELVRIGPRDETLPYGPTATMSI